jgi:type II secretory pathway component PulJ
MYRRPPSSSRAFTLLEAMLALVTLTIIGLGAGVGLQAVSKSDAALEDRLFVSAQIVSTLENLRDTAYASLASGSATSDASRTGTTYTISWTVREINPANPTASKNNSGLKELIVSCNGQSMMTWVIQ